MTMMAAQELESLLVRQEVTVLQVPAVILWIFEEYVLPDSLRVLVLYIAFFFSPCLMHHVLFKQNVYIRDMMHVAEVLSCRITCKTLVIFANQFRFNNKHV